MERKRIYLVLYAILAAALFGASTPLAKMLLKNIDPLPLAGLLYLGSGVGSALLMLVQCFVGRRDHVEPPLTRTDLPWLSWSHCRRRGGYAAFIRQIFDRLNTGRRLRLADELKVLHSLPAYRLEACTKIEVKDGPSSTIRVRNNTYSVHSRLIREKVRVCIYPEYIEVWYGQKLSDKLPRLRSRNQHRIDYRHIIDWLIRKPGAFENYKYRDDMFPTSRFRMAYDTLREQNPKLAAKEYLKILYLAAMKTEQGVDDALRLLYASGDRISSEIVKSIVLSGERIPPVTDVDIMPVDLSRYDELLGVG